MQMAIVLLNVWYWFLLTKILTIIFLVEHGFSATIGHLFNYEGLGPDINAYYANRLKIALSHPLSYWKNLDWNLNLE